MKTFLCTIVFLLQNFIPLSGQSWFAGDPHWTNRYTGSMGGYGIEQVSITGDTILGGKTTRIFSRYLSYDQGTQVTTYQRFAYQSGDTIWTWAYNKFTVLYNLSLIPGDTLIMENWPWSTLRFVIDSIGVMNISGTQLRFQKVRQLFQTTSMVCKNTIIERIGMVNGTISYPPDQNVYTWSDHFFADESSLTSSDYPKWSFCHYISDSLTLEDLSGGCPPLFPTCDVWVQILQDQEAHCRRLKVLSTGQILKPCNAPDALFYLPTGSFAKISYYPTACASHCNDGASVNVVCFDAVTTDLPSLEDTSLEVRLYPNPANGEVFIENFAPEGIIVFDAQGAIAKTISAGAEGLFSVKGLPAGCYFVKMTNRKRVVMKKLWVY